MDGKPCVRRALEAPLGGAVAAPPASRQAAGASFSDLDNALLGKILGMAGRQAGKAVTLVCKRWLRAFYSTDSGLWRELDILPPAPGQLSTTSAAGTDAAAWFASRHAQLQRCSRQVQVLHVRGGSKIQRLEAAAGQGWRLDDLLHALEPGCTQLSTVELGCQHVTAGIAHWLTRRTNLAGLSLICASLPPAATDALRQLSTLRVLHVGVNDMPDSTVLALASLTQLVTLTLQVEMQLPPQFQDLTNLCSLRRLSVRTQRSHPSLPPPCVFQSMTRCSFGAASTPALPEFQVHGSTAAFSRLLFTTTPGPGSTGASLELDGLRNVGSLPPLLATLLPPTAGLVSLSLSACSLDAGAVSGCQGCMSSLTRLSVVRGTAPGGGNFQPVLGALLAHTPQLAELAVHSCWPASQAPPAGLSEATALRKLSLCGSGASLPPGAYLQGLEDLSLPECSLDELPAALLETTGLTRLDLSNNPRLLLDSQAAEVLLRMPHLQRLELGRTRVSLHALLRLASQCGPELHIDCPDRQLGLGVPDGAPSPAVVAPAGQAAEVWDEDDLSDPSEEEEEEGEDFGEEEGAADDELEEGDEIDSDEWEGEGEM